MKPATILFVFGVLAVLAVSVAGDKKPDDKKAAAGGDKKAGDKKAAGDKKGDDKKGGDKKAGGDKKHDHKGEAGGDFGLSSNPDTPELTEYRNIMGFSEEFQEKLKSQTKVLVLVGKKDDKKCRIKRITGDGNEWENVFEHGKEFEGTLLDGRKHMMTITADKEKGTLRKVIQMDGFESIHDYVFCKKGLNLTMTAKEAVAKKSYTRLNLKGKDDQAKKVEYFNIAIELPMET